ncbi:probable tyrosyl-DNA phosphodiesterase [Hyposmocoma kahamanoa]|uniref:probable tyrosyl-DNA phosphodiesterase n=1 Tax=Hyposmocoma kahamanoa TaxID=1477025 RepID=UPI000E6D72E5|nr:probable tyrosyl-DNA phosphodiesterase [Hyposmocoma kahamanoa]
MNTIKKRKSDMEDINKPKRVKKECSYGETCYRKNPAHFREYSHPHLEAIIDSRTDSEYVVPSHLQLQKYMILEQIEIILEKQLYEPKKRVGGNSATTLETKFCDTGTSKNTIHNTIDNKVTVTKPMDKMDIAKNIKVEKDILEIAPSSSNVTTENKKIISSSNALYGMNKAGDCSTNLKTEVKTERSSSPNEIPTLLKNQTGDLDYRPIVAPTRRAEDYLKVVRPRGKMAEKHAASAPYHIFYTTINDAKETHSQPYSITFLEILDSSLGELRCSLQINFMVEISWLLAQYYFAGYRYTTTSTYLYVPLMGKGLLSSEGLGHRSPR